MTPLAIDLYCGLGGWTEGLLAEGYRVVGFDNERHHYGEAKYPAQLVLQDVLTIHGSQFKEAALIVASPPCQAYSYRAMPWKRAKALPPPDNSLFEACFRIQREACDAAGAYLHHRDWEQLPMEISGAGTMSDPTQASAARLTAIRKFAQSYVWGCADHECGGYFIGNCSACDTEAESLTKSIDAIVLAQIDTLRQENARLTALMAQRDEDMWCREENVKLKQDRDAARAALEKYGEHWERCRRVQKSQDCDCGLDDALKAGR